MCRSCCEATLLKRHSVVMIRRLEFVTALVRLAQELQCARIASTEACGLWRTTSMVPAPRIRRKSKPPRSLLQMHLPQPATYQNRRTSPAGQTRHGIAGAPAYAGRPNRDRPGCAAVAGTVTF